MGDLWGVALGGAIAVTGGAVTAILQARLQRRATREQYLWSKQAEVYLDVLRHGSGQIAHMDDDEADEQYGWAPGMEELRQDLTARVQLFGSTEVEALWRSVSQASQRLDFYVKENLLVMRGDRAVVSPDAEGDAEYTRLRQKVSADRRSLVEQLRKELDANRHLRQAA
ncbi:hypothetical protein [Streptomyces sp. NPDC001389]|uniref:hypothetical protein n=1 Tax=Streptomyces sp. NPDC001389 TaxID=3364569 RepID=UPI0036AE4178